MFHFHIGVVGHLFIIHTVCNTLCKSTDASNRTNKAVATISTVLGVHYGARHHKIPKSKKSGIFKMNN